VALDTYDALKNSIADHLDRDDLVSQIDDFIDLAEAGLRRDVRTRSMTVRAAYNIDSRYQDLPEGVLEVRSVRTNNPRWKLEYLPPDDFDAHIRETTGRPAYYTLYGNEIEFDCTPDSTYTVTLIYYGTFTPLSDAEPVNAILTDNPDLYLYGALTYSAPFLMNDERIQIWSSLYSAAVTAVNETERKARRAGRLVSRVAGRAY
jgi:hypothetical protein